MSEHPPLASAYFDALELAHAALSAPTPLRSRAGHRYARLAPRCTPEQGSPATLVEHANDDDLALALVTGDALALPAQVRARAAGYSGASERDLRPGRAHEGGR